jgi:hypothetical protein
VEKQKCPINAIPGDLAQATLVLMMDGVPGRDFVQMGTVIIIPILKIAGAQEHVIFALQTVPALLLPA